MSTESAKGKSNPFLLIDKQQSKDNQRHYHHKNNKYKVS
jgi:hypothetical protein